MPKARKIPRRTCLGCRSVRPKREMIRIVRTPAGEVLLDPTGKQAGRGAYICSCKECLKGAFAGNQLDRALEVSLAHTAREALLADLARTMG